MAQIPRLILHNQLALTRLLRRLRRSVIWLNSSSYPEFDEEQDDEDGNLTSIEESVF